MAKTWREQAAAAAASESELSLAYKLGSKLSILLSSSEQIPRELFREWDLDGDGSISRPDFRIACRKLGIVGDTSVPEAMFKLNGFSARFSREETARCDALFDSLDSDCDGHLDLDEVSNGLDELLQQVRRLRDVFTLLFPTRGVVKRS